MSQRRTSEETPLNSYNKFRQHLASGGLDMILELKRIGAYKREYIDGRWCWQVKSAGEVYRAARADLRNGIVRYWEDSFGTGKSDREMTFTLEELSITADLFSDGVHLIQCPDDLREALLQMDVPLTAEQYHQPFPTVGIETSDQFYIVNWRADERRMTVGIMTAEGSDLFYCSIEKGETFEHAFQRVYDSGSGKVEGDDHRAEMRVALNLCLFATHYGTRPTGDEKSHRDRVQNRLERARTRGNDKLVQVNQKEIALIPFRFSVNQNLPLSQIREYRRRQDSDPTGRCTAPHWRRGHWRNQAHGKGRLEHKMIAIPPVLVNADLLLGDVTDTSTTFR